jgi:arginase family enzyme
VAQNICSSQFVRALAPHIAAMDIAELNPIYDTSAHATALLAARLMLNAT